MSPTTMIANQYDLLAPLFAGAALPANAHAGLVYDRCLKIWEKKPEDAARLKELYDPLQRFVEQFNSRTGLNDRAPRLLLEHHQRLDRIGKVIRHEKYIFSVKWRMVCGLGGSHPAGCGFAFDPIIGVPIISGSAIKGMCRHSAQMMEYNFQQIKTLFGSEETGPGNGAFAGDLVFFDAFPIHWPKLCVDIVNCHHAQYYATSVAEKKSVPPLEIESPVPVFFIAVDQDTSFAFRLVSKLDLKENLKIAANLLERGLDLLGLGGKTAVGYGAFKRVTA